MIRRGQKDTSSSGVHRKRSCSCTSGALSTTSRTQVLRYVMFENSINTLCGREGQKYSVQKTVFILLEPPNIFCGQIETVTVTTYDCDQHNLLNNSNEINWKLPGCTLRNSHAWGDSSFCHCAAAPDKHNSTAI